MIFFFSKIGFYSSQSVDCHIIQRPSGFVVVGGGGGGGDGSGGGGGGGGDDDVA